MSTTGDALIGLGSTLGAGIVAVMPTDPATIEALAKWPAVMALAAVSIYSIYSMNKISDRAYKSADKHADALNNLASQLSQRPCVRDPHND